MKCPFRFERLERWALGTALSLGVVTAAGCGEGSSGEVAYTQEFEKPAAQTATADTTNPYEDRKREKDGVEEQVTAPTSTRNPRRQ